MKGNVRRISGNWKDGYVLDKHTASSVYVGDDENGHPQFDTTRTEVGEALFQLKYRGDWHRIGSLATAVADTILPLLPQIDVIVPMPASSPRSRQPVTELAQALSKIAGIPVDTLALTKSPTPQLKNLHSKDEKMAALDGHLSVGRLGGSGLNVLLLDDLFHTGASMETACNALASHPGVAAVYVTALTWR